MKKFNFILSIVLFIIPAVIGISLFVFPFGQNVPMFTKIGLTMIGIIGLSVRLILLLANKKLKRFQQQEYENSQSYKISKHISSALEEAKKAGAEEQKNKKITCKFCRCSFDSFLDKCPNCGAPPEREN